MTGPSVLINTLFDCFDKSARKDFRAYLASNSEVKKWQIAADFCLHDKERPNDTFAFSLIPYDAYPQELFQEIKNKVPKDLKKTRDVPDASIAFLRESRRFHFAFILSEQATIFDNGDGKDPPLKIARESIDMTIYAMRNAGRSEANLRRLKLLKKEAQANRFNTSLLTDLYVFAYLICFVSLALARERDLKVIGWFADRDSMNTWCDGVVWDIASETLHGLADHLHIEIPESAPAIAIPDPELPAHEAMWYDEFVRIPDYFAGILAAWDLDQNLVPGDREKYKKLSRELIADAHNTAIFRVSYVPAQIAVSRCLFSLDAPSGDLEKSESQNFNLPNEAVNRDIEEE